MIAGTIYLISLTEFVTQLLPLLLRQSKNQAWLNALTKPLRTSYDAFVVTKDRELYITAHNASITLFEQALNDSFDVDERRIYINNATLSYGEYWYDDDPIFFYDDSPEYFYDPETFNQGGGNFTVYVPEAIRPETQDAEDKFITELKGEIELYKIYGTTYKIEWYA